MDYFKDITYMYSDYWLIYKQESINLPVFCFVIHYLYFDEIVTDMNLIVGELNDKLLRKAAIPKTFSSLVPLQ
jgi:hypothetical protein